MIAHDTVTDAPHDPHQMKITIVSNPAFMTILVSG